VCVSLLFISFLDFFIRFCCFNKHTFQIIAYKFFEYDPEYTLSRVSAVHKEGNSQGVKVVNGDTWLMTKADGRKSDERQLRGITETSEDQYVNGRDESYPGRVVAKLPWIGLPLAWVGGSGSLLVYVAIVIYVVYSVFLAGRAAKKARAAAKPRIPTKVSSH
jgi:hypothetical protein